jgi:hypothetical protein
MAIKIRGFEKKARNNLFFNIPAIILETEQIKRFLKLAFKLLTHLYLPKTTKD